jgi:hypothetical protein
MAKAKKLKVLFIGNSFTARNNVPGLIATMAAERGLTLEHRLINRGGASLKMHWNAGEAGRAIESGGYDAVVLQEQSTLPVKSRERTHENVRVFDAAIKAAGSKTVLYMTWARKHAPETQAALTEAYTSIGKELGARVAPAGVAWERFLSKHDKPVLHDKDGSHPTLAGSYLAACVLFGTLFGEDPAALDGAVDGLSDADAALLRRAARDAMK